ncbi:RluA family pseudouridine synthase [Corticicoccus populi]|uniref:Pseudouridine synthase n=1 Tax=Corticicoccus populi TaxID=1812821 RepID=A0ABW5WY64_9STAP
MNKRTRTQKQDTTWVVKEKTEVLKFLIEMMPSQSRKSVKSILSRGQIFVNGKGTTQFNDELVPGDRVEIRSAASNIKLKGIQIFHEDEDIIVVEKEAGVLSIASEKESKITAYRLLSDYVQKKNPRNRIFVVHRLDRDTSGVMVFARRREVQQKLQNAWKNAVKERTYIALVEGTVTEGGKITSWLTENKALIMRSSKNPNKGKKAVTRYKVLKSNKKFSLLKVNLDTGRKNQIRVHMQDLGHPIVGDKKYGAQNNPIRRIGLHAHVISFNHPVTGELLRFESKVPEEFTRGFK